MNAAGRLGLYGAGLVVVFGAAFAAAGAVVPAGTVAAWTANGADGTEGADGAPGGHGGSGAHGDEGSGGHGAEESAAGKTADHVNGVALAASGFVLGPVQAPADTGIDGELAFQIQDADGEAVTDYDVAHDKQLHLIVVRTDGSGFRHVPPEPDATTGTWSLPWSWAAAGTYRVYADFTSGGVAATLSRTVDVAGDLSPAPASTVSTADAVDGYDVTIHGDLVAGAGSDLRVEVRKDGAPVTALQPYLGAFGHLVALRQGDLAYLHVHAHGDEPRPGALAGPTVDFTAEVPTAGRYLLYLDFQVDGVVHTARFVLDAEGDAS